MDEDRHAGGCLRQLANILAVLTIGLILAGMLLPALGQVTPKGRRLNCMGNLKQIGLALTIYAGDDAEAGMFPSGNDFGLLNDLRYLEDGKVYSCTSSRSRSALAASSNYVYVGSGLSNQDPAPASTILAHDHIDNHAWEHKSRNWTWFSRPGWVNVLFADGRVEGVQAKTSEAFHKIVKKRGWTLPGATEEETANEH
jgi:prepilin-type processing-associated H-X9-DG protein